MTLYLINSPAPGKPRSRKARKRTTTTRSKTMVTPRRSAKGRFMKGGGTAARRRTRRKAAPQAATRRRTTYRANPPRPRARDIVGRIQSGLTDGLNVLLGEAAARAIPTLFRLPTAGAVGIGVQLATAVGIGMVAERLVSRDAARMMVAGGVSAGLQSLVIAYNVPFLAPALQPGTVSGYPQGGRLIGYPRQPINRMAGYPQAHSGLQVAPFVSSAGTGAGSF